MRRIAGLLAAAAFVVSAGCAQSGDAGITADVKTKFAADDFVKAHEVNVDTKDSVVTLSGIVDSRATEQRAVRLAKETSGVRDVIDRLTVGGREREAEATTGTNPPDYKETPGGTDVKTDAQRAGEVVKSGAKTLGTSVKESVEHLKDKVDGDNDDSPNDRR